MRLPNSGEVKVLAERLINVFGKGNEAATACLIVVEVAGDASGVRAKENIVKKVER